MTVIGVTGTDGKTSCAWLLARALDALGTRCGYLGTLGFGFTDDLAEASHTTPDAVAVQDWLARFVTADAAADGVEYGIVEDYTGHGIGEEMHLPPMVPNYRVQGRAPRTPVGGTIAIEPMVTLGDQANHVLADDWTVVTDSGRPAAHWEHSVALTEHGIWVLTALDGGEAELTARGAPFGPLD